jgi:hypothetical protein
MWKITHFPAFHIKVVCHYADLAEIDIAAAHKRVGPIENIKL